MSPRPGQPSPVPEETYSVEDVQAPQTQPYDPEPRREQLRGILAITLVGIVAVTVVLSFVAIWWEWATASEIKELLGAIFPPLIALDRFIGFSPQFTL